MKMKFKDLANYIMNKCILMKGDTRYRICEIELYMYSEDKHPDGYVHCSDEQLLSNRWYFHKRGAGYKEGTYKGLDWTLGNGTNQYTGVLIRSIMNLETGEFTEGPCRCVNELIDNIKVSEYLSDIPDEELPMDIFNNSKNLIIVPIIPIEKEEETKTNTLNNNVLENVPMYRGKRYGLSDKYPEYRNKKYRYLIYKNKIAKQKSDLELVV